MPPKVLPNPHHHLLNLVITFDPVSEFSGGTFDESPSPSDGHDDELRIGGITLISGLPNVDPISMISNERFL